MNTRADVESSYPEGNHRTYYIQFRARAIFKNFSPNIREVFIIEVGTNDEKSG
jgi:hypothetical protein